MFIGDSSEMVAKDRQKNTGSPKVVVGEIDTSAPFQSVKDAVNLFGEGAFSGEKPATRKVKAYSAERVLAKETQLHLVQKELNKLKDQLKNAESTRAQALSDLEKAKRTVEGLTAKLNTVGESKNLAIKATEVAKNHMDKMEEAERCNSNGVDGSQRENLESAREHYMAVSAELDATKQDLRKIRQDYDASGEAKAAAIKQVAEAEVAAKANMEKAGELSKEIAVLQESIEQVKLASMQSQDEEAKLYADKDVLKQSYKTRLEESANKLNALKKEIDPELTRNLETQLAETMLQIEQLRKEMDSTKASDLDSVKMVTTELDDAKESLQKVAEEESSMRSLVEKLKLELENVKKEHSELKEKEADTESIAGNLHVKLRKTKSELEAALGEKSKIEGASDDMLSTLEQLSSENEIARNEAEEMKKQAEELKKESEATRILLEEAEERLKVGLQDAEEAKVAEASALDQIKVMSERTNAARASTSETGAQITISRDEFESLSKKVEESDKLAEMKVAAAIAQVEAVKASENEALKKLEATQKEIDEIKAATQEALKRAEMAEAAKKAVEGELRRWHEREQKKAAEAASRILAETDMSFTASPNNYRIQKQNPPEKRMEFRKLDRAKTSVSRKVLMPSITGIFHRKRNQVEGGSPSYLPGEEPV
ncbi:WEB family protein At5g55860 [Coffea eugenioides]|uniref:WEB family protein At5g55860 n=1 Tax=Coffea eugenioides TaxID=49369 RepID=UPI000F60A3D9|nr:WEB family protein At5g55860 [Coffea eugenioides]XP_027170276.1 WEB family protein At5g55860 [Coffea eugenioides]